MGSLIKAFRLLVWVQNLNFKLESFVFLTETSVNHKFFWNMKYKLRNIY